MEFYVKKLIVIGLLLLASCTPKPESQVTESLQKEFSKEDGLAEYSKSLDKIYGKEASKFKSSFMDFFSDRIKFQVTDVKAEGEKASANINVTVPNRKDVQGLVGITAFMNWKDLKDTTLDELINKIGKGAKPPLTSSRDIKDETIKESVELNRDGAGQWKLDPASKRKVSDSVANSKSK